MARTFYCIAAIFLLMSCGQPAQQPPPVEKTETTVPGIDSVAFTDTIALKASEAMRFDKELFRIRTGKKIRLILKNMSLRSAASMSHNVVILNKGTDIADFADVARTAKNEHYVPSSLAALIIAHTGMVGGGASEEVEFTIRQPGVYDYICSYPGHWGTMQGKIVAEP